MEILTSWIQEHGHKLASVIFSGEWYEKFEYVEVKWLYDSTVKENSIPGIIGYSTRRLRNNKNSSSYQRPGQKHVSDA